MAETLANTSEQGDSLHATGFQKGVTEEQVQAIFAQYGTVKSVKVLEAKADKPDAAAIITMDAAEQATWIIENVSGKTPTGLTAPLIITKKIVNTWNTSANADNAAVLHVTGIPKGATEEQVQAIFAQYGAVKSVKVLEAKADKPDGAAIITMEAEEKATWLIENISGTTPTGLTEPLIIKKKMSSTWGKGYGKGIPAWAYQQMMAYYGKGKGKGFGKGSGLSSFAADKKVWIGGIPEEGVTFRELQAHFPGSKFATVMRGKGAGTGGVAFATSEEAAAAIATLNGSTIAGATIVVDVWTKKEQVPTDDA